MLFLVSCLGLWLVLVLCFVVLCSVRMGRVGFIMVVWCVLVVGPLCVMLTVGNLLEFV